MRRLGGWGAGLLVSALAAGLATEAPAAGVYRFVDRSGVAYYTNAPVDGRYRPLLEGKGRVVRTAFAPATRGRGRAWGRLRRSPWRAGSRVPDPWLARSIRRAALRHEVDPALVHAIVRAESGFDPLAVSRRGALGLMQLMPATAAEVGVRDAFHPAENLEGGVSYLRGLLDRYGGDVRLALAAYNAGPGAVERAGGIPPFAETRAYVERVLRFRREYRRRLSRGARRFASRAAAGG